MTNAAAAIQAEAKAQGLLADKSLAELCQLFDATNTDNREGVYTVRGWLMDAIEAEVGTERFNEWIDCEDVEQMTYAGKFFL